MRFLLFIVLLCICADFAYGSDPSEVHVHLNSPTYQDGVLETHEGGVLEGDQIRIQAKNIRYVKRGEAPHEEWHVKASGNVVLRYNQQTFVGHELKYNFSKRKGTLIDGRTQIGCWFVGCKHIELLEDNSYQLRKTSITTCDSGKGIWQIYVGRGSVQEYDVLSATNAQVRVLKVPIFWFPYFKVKLSTLKDVPASYNFITGGSQGQRVGLRYLAYSSQAFKAYLQLDFWFKKGPDGSVQFDYKAPNHPTTFQANNFIAYDKQGRHPPSGANSYPFLRQRYVGELNTTIAGRLHINGQYERFSDPYVLETYFNRDYFLQVMRNTQLQFSMHEKTWLAYLRSRVRINRFQTVNQELPTFHFSLKPLSLGRTGFISSGTVSAGYLDYVFGSFVDNRFNNFQSPRLEINPKICRPFYFYGLSITPFATYIGIGYGQSQRSKVVWNSLGVVGAEANYKLSKTFNNRVRHTIEPYTSYQFMTRPTVDLADHYIFDINDAYSKLNQLRWGLRNNLYVKNKDQFSNPLTLDVYTYGFFNNTTIGTFIPKMYVEVTQRLPFMFTSFASAYDFQHNRLDVANVRTAITFSENFALSFLFMHRSPYEYKKSVQNSFLLDVARSQARLLSSPLSDRRNTALSKIYWRVCRDVIFQFESRHGWLRDNSPPYNEMRFDITLLLPCNWRFQFSPMRVISPNPGAKYIWRWEFSLLLGGKPPSKTSGPYIFW